MREHTKEPWRVVDWGDGKFSIAETEDRGRHPYIADLSSHSFWSECGDNARRIVACVNACAGIPTELLEAGNGVADAVRHFQTQRDELLAALKEARRWIGDGDMSDDVAGESVWSIQYRKVIADTDAVLAKCEA